MYRNMNPSLLEAVQATLAIIESSLTRPLTITDLAASIHMSPHHAHRVLSRAVGQPIMNYVRARRLSASIELLLQPHLRIIDISQYFAFEHEQSYIRAFRKQFQVTPAQFRKAPIPLDLTEKANLAHVTGVKEGLLFRPAVVFKPALLLIGSRHVIHQADNLEHYTANLTANAFMEKDRLRIRNRIQEDVYIGLTQYHPDPASTFSYYIPSVQVSSFDSVPEGLEHNLLPPSKYIVFTFTGGFHPRHVTIKHLEAVWDYIEKYVVLHQANFFQSMPFHFEYIDQRLASEEYCEVDIYFPIQSTLRD